MVDYSLETGLAHRQSFAALRSKFADGSDTPSALLARCLETIEKHEKDVGAFVATAFDSARAEAAASDERWKAGQPLSAIDGMPVGVKDVMETANMPTEQGSPLFKGWRGNRDCAAVAALREAGAVIVAKTVTTEFAATTPRGTKNPWDTSRTPGGSSSGSAASVGIGMLSAALGSQVIGSIIRPASFCGAVGFKPSVGGINRGGSFDGFSQSCTGILAASLADGWTAMRAISARAGGDAGYIGLTGPMEMPDAVQPSRIAVLETAGWEVASEAAKSALGAVLIKLSNAGITLSNRMDDADVSAIEDVIAQAVPISRDINAWEGRWPLNTYARDMDRSKLSEPALQRLSDAEKMTQEDYAVLVARRDEARQAYTGLQQKFDICLTLAATGIAPEGLGHTGDPVFTVPTSMLGIPALSLPVMEIDGLPLGLQLIGFEGRDADLFAAAAAIEAILTD